ncbi:hypothetical protein ACKI2C_48700, partial [Streptomyces brasiliscabiei]|uniref:hypothetical protein n=1 Tax=Streptomyces brasiliscabiei TaxID=2736302 RepID=UPI0038F5EDFB
EAGEWDWGVCLGETDVASWTARRRGIVTYLGWSHTYGANTASITTGQTAGDNSTPFNPQEDDMADSIIVSCTDPDRNGIWMMGPSHIHQFTAEEW